MPKVQANAQGFSLAEILVAMLLIAVALVPALQALRSGVQAAKIDIGLTQETRAAKMEQLLARPFAALLVAAKSGGNALGSNNAAILPYDPNAALTYPLPASLPAGPGFSDNAYDVFIDCLDPATGNALTTGACKTLLRIKVVAKNTNQILVSYRSQ